MGSETVGLRPKNTSPVPRRELVGKRFIPVVPELLDYDLETDVNGEEFLEFSPDYWLPLLPAVGFLWEF